ncbi:hypothetical protein, partial [Synechococcus sp. H70.1]|uniref:hypothetical protein n=1 Tax=Synechococcus sp. H70.1 TaxID=2964527 RepID=UPI0039C6B302
FIQRGAASSPAFVAGSAAAKKIQPKRSFDPQRLGEARRGAVFLGQAHPTASGKPGGDGPTLPQGGPIAMLNQQRNG